MKPEFLIVIGIISAVTITAVTIGTIEYQSMYNNNCNSDGGYVTGFLSCTRVHEDFSDPRITGKMAREICSVTGGECPPNYPANVLDDGSMMVGVTIWNAETNSEKSYVFTIVNNTLSYELNQSAFDDVSSIPESNFSQRYHLSIFHNSKTMMQYVTPDFITIGPGEQVTWSNYAEIPVTITSNDPDNPWSTGVILPDDYTTLTFDENGIYEYHGRPGTHGFIVVMNDDGQLLESKFNEVFGNGSPLAYNEGMSPVFLYDNCKRYVYWLNEHGHEDIHVSEDYPRYPPWGNQIFPLVEYCLDVGSLIKSNSGDNVKWRFEINEN